MSPAKLEGLINGSPFSIITNRDTSFSNLTAQIKEGDKRVRPIQLQRTYNLKWNAKAEKPRAILHKNGTLIYTHVDLRPNEDQASKSVTLDLKDGSHIDAILFAIPDMPIKSSMPTQKQSQKSSPRIRRQLR